MATPKKPKTEYELYFLEVTDFSVSYRSGLNYKAVEAANKYDDQVPEFTGAYNKPEAPTAIDKIRLKPDTFIKAKKLAKGCDIYAIEDDWRIMLAERGGEVPRSPDGSFINFVKWYARERGKATAGA